MCTCQSYGIDRNNLKQKQCVFYGHTDIYTSMNIDYGWWYKLVGVDPCPCSRYHSILVNNVPHSKNRIDGSWGDYPEHGLRPVSIHAYVS